MLVKDFNIKVTVRNSRLLHLIEEKFGTQAEFSRACGVSSGIVSAFMTFRQSPVTKNGWSEMAENISAGLGVYPSDIWPDHLREVRLKQATASFDLDQEEVKNIISKSDNPLKFIENKQVIEFLREGLSERYSDFLDWRLTEGADATYAECGDYLGVSVERARQIEHKLINTMRRKAITSGLLKIKTPEGDDPPGLD